MLTSTQKEFLASAAAAAVAAEQPTGVPALLTTAQWADESGWGQHQPGNNPFGIKAVPGQAYTRHITSESPTDPTKDVYQDFAAYLDLPSAFQAHNVLIAAGTYFKAAFVQYQTNQDFPALVRNVAEHYAMAANYADIILAISRMPEVQVAIQEARG